MRLNYLRPTPPTRAAAADATTPAPDPERRVRIRLVQVTEHAEQLASGSTPARSEAQIARELRVKVARTLLARPITDALLAMAVGCCPRSIRNWRQKRNVPQPRFARRMQAVGIIVAEARA